jgi:hypothetical protein
MERHSSLPDGKNLQGMDKVVGSVVEEDVPQSPAENNSYRQIEYHISYIVRGKGKGTLPDSPENYEIGGNEPQYVHQAIPPELEGTDAKENRVDVRKLHGCSSSGEIMLP